VVGGLDQLIPVRATDATEQSTPPVVPPPGFNWANTWVEPTEQLTGQLTGQPAGQTADRAAGPTGDIPAGEAAAIPTDQTGDDTRDLPF